MNKNIIKVLLFSGYGVDSVTNEMKTIMDKYDFPRNRIGEICNYVESKAKYMDYTKLSFNEISKFLEKNKEEIVLFDDSYYIYEPILRMPCKLSIKEVYINRPWTIMNYDGAEYIKYLDYNIIDKEIYYCSYKKEND